MEIKRLDWDSDFFGLEMGEIANNSDLSDADKYQFLILIQTEDTKLAIKGFKNTFNEIKVVFSKRLKKANLILGKMTIFDFEYDFEGIHKSDLYSLAYESGKYSRFKLDNRFNENQFKKLYDKWIDNSLNKKFADKIFYIKNLNDIIGFITIKNDKNFSRIGLIAVSEKHQGKGIGTQLLKKAEDYCLTEGILELRIPTQKENVNACNFYKKSGYTIHEEKVIKHYWRN